jgi:Ca2+-transporting ATPase
LKPNIRSLVRRASVESAVVAAVLSPFPLADEVALVPFYGALGMRIGRRRTLRYREIPWRPMAMTVGKGLVARGVVNFGITLIPGVDTVVNAATAATLTEVLGHYFDEACASPKTAEPLEFARLVSALAEQRASRERGRTRVRLRVGGLLGSTKQQARIERALAKLPFVCEVKANPKSGRVLVRLDRPWGEVGDEIERVIGELEGGAPMPPTAGDAVRWLQQRAKSVAKEAARALRGEDSVETAGGGGGATGPAKVYAIEANEAANRLGADPKRGLTTEQAQERLGAYGPNLLSGMKRRSGADILAGELINLPMALLSGSMLLSAATGDLLEAGAIAFVMGSNVVIGYLSESRAEDLLKAWGRLRAEHATVVRDGRRMRLEASQLVPGDVVLLRAGETIAADARILETSELTVDESTLTGESEPVEKSASPTAPDATLADRSSMLHAGTVVAGGECRAVVVATGNATELGVLQRSLSRTEERTAPLERQLGDLGRRLAMLSLGSSVVVTTLGAISGKPVRELVRNAVALGVAAIPEGFPAVGTTALALASQRLQKEGIIIRRLAAAETLGAVSVICADKTGTLTENRMRLAEIFLPGRGSIQVAWSDGRFELRSSDGQTVAQDAVHDLARIAALNADVEVNEKGVITQASGTERALVEFALGAGYPVRSRRRTAKRVGERRRSAESPIMLTVHEHPELGRIELAKGAPEEVVARCSGLDQAARGAIMEENAAMAGRGLRVLGFAWRREPQPVLEFAGLIGLRDPPKSNVRDAMQTLGHAGIEALMLTGDQRRTAVAIGRALGIPEDSVYSRVTPEAKLDIVRDLQRRGSVVAMTGDGVNDGPALKAADVGIAMGERGTDLARAVADVVLAHDDLSSLVRATSEGRTLYDNVRRAIDYLVATNMSEVAVMLVGSLAGAFALSPLHLLWINVMTDIAPALALAVEPPEGNVMARPPRDPSAPLFGADDSRRLGKRAGQMALGALVAYGVGARGGNGSAPAASTMAFASLITSQLLETRNHRAVTGTHNPWLQRVLLGSFAVQGASLALPPVRQLLGNAPLPPQAIAVAVATGIVAARLGGRPFVSLLPTEEIVGVRRIDS